MNRLPKRLAVNLFVMIMVVVWTLPTAGLVITSFRQADQVAHSGWWTVFNSSMQNLMVRLPGDMAILGPDGTYRKSGKLLDAGAGTVSAFGISSLAMTAFKPGESVELLNGARLSVAKNGAYTLVGHLKLQSQVGTRVFLQIVSQPRLTFRNYVEVIQTAGIGRSLLSTLIVVIPSTILPAATASLAAYALAWMRFPGRTLLIVSATVLLMVPLQMCLIPLMTLYNSVGHAVGFEPKNYIGLWLAHTGFGLPLAICLMQSYMARIPPGIVESAQLDGASDFEIYSQIVMPLSYPVVASFCVFQFVWTWNDLLVAMVFLGQQDDTMVMSGRLVNLMGTYGGRWEVLGASTCVSIILPVAVFLVLQGWMARGIFPKTIANVILKQSN